ncbi:hypothetical protein [Labilibacter marinus]|uniref:hypothetical protein n=1 Tax=Labilibacter marinus TaxID=1477105 RepID=UPI000830659F|nr:hypothetical protein [Labilibacter marinus]
MISKDKTQFKVIVAVVAVLIVLQLVYVLNRDYLRPSFQINNFIVVLLGSLPNFLAAFAAGIVFIPIALFYLNKRMGNYVVYSFTAICLTMLIREEFEPFMFGSIVNDFNDIVASIIGAVLALLLFEQTKLKILKRKIQAN